MVCPITHACFRELNRAYFVSNGYLYEDLADAWAELGEDIQRDEPSEQSLRLRGFYLVEVLYHDLVADRPNVYGRLVNTNYGSLADARIPKLFFCEYPRSYEGLTSLIQVCERELVALTADQGEMLLGGNDSELKAWKMLASRLDTPKCVVTACMNAATHLRSSLSGDVSGLPTVGRLFATASVERTVGVQNAITYMRASLRTSVHNPTSPFNRVDV